MKKSKRAQGSLMAIILLLFFVMLLVIGLILVILIKPNLIQTLQQPVQQPTIIVKTIQETPLQPTCFYPFRQLGNTCCTDSDMNNICDSDEIKKSNTLRCSYPYMRDGDSCCLDDNDNGLCDMYKHHYVRYYYRYSRDYRSSGQECHRYYDSNRSQYYYDCY